MEESKTQKVNHFKDSETFSENTNLEFTDMFLNGLEYLPESNKKSGKRILLRFLVFLLFEQKLSHRTRTIGDKYDVNTPQHRKTKKNLKNVFDQKIIQIFPGRSRKTSKNTMKTLICRAHPQEDWKNSKENWKILGKIT